MEREYRELIWSEGMFLVPQHLQFTQRNLDTKLRQATESLIPHGWGFQHLEIDTPSLSSSLFSLRSCRVVLEDGTLLSLPGNLDLSPRSLKEGVAGADEFVDVYLGVPCWRPDVPNTLGQGDGGSILERRYRVDETRVVDENSGDSPRPLKVKRFQGRLLWGTEDGVGYDRIRLARVKMSPSGQSLTLAPDYIPPLLDIRAWPPLMALCEDISNGLTMAYNALVRDFADREFTELLGMPRGLEAVTKMLATAGYVASLQEMCNAPHLHPYIIFLELSRLAATLGVFRGKRAMAALPGYRHDELGRSFGGVKEVIDGLLDRIGTSTFIQRSFQLLQDRHEVALEAEWISSNRLLYIGVTGEDNVPRLDRNINRIKLCSPQDFSAIIQKRLGGVGIRRLRKAPGALPERMGTHYFQINMEGDFWSSIEQERAIILAGTLDLGYQFTLYVV